MENEACSCNEFQRSEGLSRRSMLKAAGAGAALSSVPLSATTRVALGAPGDHTLVLLALRGGFDGLSAIAPVGDNAYYVARPSIGVPAYSAISLDRTFGMHPGLAPAKGLWDDGHMAVVHAVGQARPSRSHFSAMAELERAAPGSSVRTGWLDRVVGNIDHARPLAAVQLGDTSLHGQFEGSQPEVVAKSLSRMDFNYANSREQRLHWSDALTAMYNDPEGVPNGKHRQYLATTAAGACNTVAETQDMLVKHPIEGDRNYRGPAQTTKGYTKFKHGEDLATSLQDVARMLKSGVGVRVVSIEIPNWDMHANQGGPEQGPMFDQLRSLAQNIKAFRYDIGDNLWSKTTLVSLSEFGRRVDENGSRGTDHGFGNAVMLFGGSVKGRKIHGNWPGIRPENLVDGDLNGVNDYRQIIAEIVDRRMNAGDITKVFPGLKYRPIGVMR